MDRGVPAPAPRVRYTTPRTSIVSGPSTTPGPSTTLGGPRHRKLASLYRYANLFQIAALYKLALKLTTTVTTSWLSQGKILPPTAATVSIHWTHYRVLPIERYIFYWQMIICGRELLPTARMPPASFLTNVRRTLQVQSGEDPASVAFSEDSVLYAQALPTFDSTLSEEDSESLLSCLSVPRLRIPLTLDFFSHGRSGALLNTELQRLLVGALFEIGAISTTLLV